MDYQKKELPKKFSMTGWALVASGIVIVVVSYLVNPMRASFNNVIALMFMTGISVGALVLVALEHLSGAVWSTPMRRVSEFLAASIPFVAVLAIPLLFNLQGLFQWTHLDVVKSDVNLQGKTPYLNTGFFIIRYVVFFAVLFLFYLIFTRNSYKQDDTKDQSYTSRNVKFSAGFMPVVAIVLSFLAIDWMMSLSPHWYSTIFGIYYITATLLAGLAATTFAAVSLSEKGYLHSSIGPDHYYSFGALLFGMTNFWAYIAFSQFMLIWYANIPEETTWFIMRWTGGWKYVSIAMIVIRFAIPYFGLLTARAKTDPKRLKIVSIIILAAHLFDMYWLVMPTYSDTALFSFFEIGFPVLITGILIVVFSFQAKKHNLIPIGDPKLQRGLDFHL
jgi:hypothetical protein